jgi:FixJ family two-component response regulator
MSAAAGTTIAVVDDDDSLRISLLRLFRSAGYSVAAFATATELWSHMSLGRPDCVVLDLQLPGMSGVELLRHFSTLADPPPVIVITGSDDELLRDQCIALGSKRYFRKPLDSDALLDAAGRVVGSANRRARPSN